MTKEESYDEDFDSTNGNNHHTDDDEDSSLNNNTSDKNKDISNNNDDYSNIRLNNNSNNNISNSNNSNNKNNDNNNIQLNGAVLEHEYHDEEEDDGRQENKKMLEKEDSFDQDDEEDEDNDEVGPLKKKKKNSEIKDQEQDDEPPPPIPRHIWIRVLLIYYAVFSDGLSLTLIQPFLPNVLEDRWGYSPEDVGYASGLLIGCYSFARFGSGFYLGHLSDKYGRKPFLIMSLLVTGVGTAIFGLLPNFTLALILRFVEGILSNTTALCQATLADMVDKRNRAAVFAYLGGTYALSRCISSSLGGFVVKIFEDYENPYIYPCVIGGAVVILSGVLLLIALPETHPKYTKLDYGHHKGIPMKPLSTIETSSGGNDDSVGENGEVKAVAIVVEPPKKDKTFKEGMTIILKDRALLLLMVVGGLNSYCNGGLLLSLVLFSSLSLDHHGLGFGPAEAGIIFSILGFFGFLWQVLLFKKVSGRFGLKRQYTVGMILLSVGMALFPLSYIAYYIQGIPLVWVTIGIVVPIISVGFMSGLPIVQGMVANCSNPEVQGLTQGSTQSINSMLRSFGPAISGAIFSVSSGVNAPWVLFMILSAIYVVIAVISLYIDDSVDINHIPNKNRKQNQNNNNNKKIIKN